MATDWWNDPYYYMTDGAIHYPHQYYTTNSNPYYNAFIPTLDYGATISTLNNINYTIPISDLKSLENASKEEVNQAMKPLSVIDQFASKEIAAGISEEIIAYGLVQAMSKQAEAIVGETELPLIKMTDSMLEKIREHLQNQLSNLATAKADEVYLNREGQRHRLQNYYKALIALTER